MSMNKLKEYIAKGKEKTLILSLDLDNTLVNRDLGNNWVLPQTIELLDKLKKQNKIKLLINTGRELMGYAAFCKEVTNINNAILGSGSIILVNGKSIFNKRGEIEKEIVERFLNSVRNGVLPFVDFSHSQGRSLYFNDDVVEKEGFMDLFYSQNPRGWFGDVLPPCISIKNDDTHPKQIFRVEFPISNDQKIFYDKISSKSSDAIQSMADLLGTDSSIEKKYMLKKKAFFNDKFKDRCVFGRLERSSKFINKGIGLVKWLEQSEISMSKVLVVHIGDRDSGIIDDTLVKQHITDAFMIMVGEKSKSDNSSVDLYMKGAVDQAVYDVLEMVNVLSNQ